MADNTYPWRIWQASLPDDVVNYLNGVAPYRKPVRDAQICATWSEDKLRFRVFAQPGPPLFPGLRWRWTQCPTPDAVVATLNTPGSAPVRARICTILHAGQLEFVVFYQPASAAGKPAGWKTKLAPSPAKAVDLLNGVAPHGRPLAAAEIAAGWNGQEPHFHVFYQRQERREPSPRWRWDCYNGAAAVQSALNQSRPDGSPPPAPAVVAAVQSGRIAEFYVFSGAD